MRKTLLFILCLLFLGANAQEQQTYNAEQQAGSQTNCSSQKERHIFTGFSGGMMLHIGYAFAKSPDELFRNAALQTATNKPDLPQDGVLLGIGGALRIHLLNHIHVGAEGGVSTIPVMRSGSHIRSGWGAALCDFYFSLGKVKPLVGISLGGGSMSRLYVPNNAETASTSENMVYNASYTKTPFFLMDPYIGLEMPVGKHLGILLRLDYMLPFGHNTSKLAAPNIKWSNFVRPSGPRLYLGFMFMHDTKK